MKPSIRQLPRNLWAVSLTSFLTDISSEMVLNILPLFLANVVGARTGLIGLIEGVSEAISSLLKIFSGWLSDRTRARKWLAVAGYGISTLVKPFFYFTTSWEGVAAARWADRAGKGIRTAPRDALVADSIDEKQRGLAFGLHRAADTAGALLGMLIALGIVWLVQGAAIQLSRDTFQTLVLVSVIPAVLGVISLAWIARDVPVTSTREMPRFALKALGKPFIIFLLIISIFELGNSSDAFLVLRAQERGVSVAGILGMLIVFNLVYSLVSAPAGSLSDRVGRKRVIIIGWLIYAAVYIGFAMASVTWQIWVLYAFYGLYYGLAYGTAKALIADLIAPELRGTAYGTYAAAIGILDLVASVIAGGLWQGVGGWEGFGPSAPFIFGSLMALMAALMIGVWNYGVPVRN